MVLFYTPSSSPAIWRYSNLIAVLKLGKFFDPLRAVRIYRPDFYLHMTKNSDVEAKELHVLVEELPYAMSTEPREIMFMNFIPVADEFHRVDEAVSGRTLELHWYDGKGYYHELVLSEPLMKETLYGYDVRYEDKPDPVYDEGTIRVPAEVNIILAGFKEKMERDMVVNEIVGRLVELYGIRDYTINENFTSLDFRLEGDKK